jgi:hypothetical protein
MKILEFLDKGWFKTVLQIIQLSLTIFAVWFSYNTAQRGAESNAKNLKIFQSMAAADSSINEVTKGILINLQSIPGASESFKKGIDKMEGSISSLERNLSTFSLSVQDYGNVLKPVAQATEKNVELIQKQQLIWEQELHKAPDLKLLLDRAHADTTGKIQIQTQIANLGNGIVREFTLLIKCPKAYELRSSRLYAWDSTATVQSFSYSFSQIIVPARKGEKFYRFKSNELAFNVNKLPKQNLPYKFQYEIIHEKGSSEGDLVISQSDIVGYK